ncbi:MAG TPA: L,D-transpeptidase family protein [Papillibacter sp.]|nr:L,D-transpeptidase family protein [Papillibacter sp.]
MSRVKRAISRLVTAALIAMVLCGFASAAEKESIPGGISFAIPEDGCALFVDLDSRRLTVFLDGSVLATYPVSGGKSETPSPVGTWTIVSIASWGEGFGGSWLGLDVPWGTYGIHGTKTPWVVGQKNVSHGCIRMRDEDVAKLKRIVSLGTVVHIRHNSLPFRPLKNGMIGSDVRRVQAMLRTLGFYSGTADGIFGNDTMHAVTAFQKAHGLNPDGVVGYTTFDLMASLTS